jgi:hypothetical protein
MLGTMSHRSLSLAALVVSLLPFSSCTCQRQASEPPKVTERSGFGAIMTPRKLPERVEARITPQQPEPAEKEAPTPAAKLPQTTVPENFPEGVPIPEGSEVMAVQSLANDARNVIFATEGDSPQLFKLYKDSMEESGWGNPTQEYQGQEQSFLSFKKDDTIINISVSKDPRSGKRVVAVMYYEEKPLPFPEF